MANEYLKRTPTSTGNAKVFTWSGWVKRNALGSFQGIFSATSRVLLVFTDQDKLRIGTQSVDYEISSATFRDVGSWMHILLAIDTTLSSGRYKVYVNGIKVLSGVTNLSINADVGPTTSATTNFDYAYSPGQTVEGEALDVFFVDGQALTPDVFGFYKDGNGYVSAGSTQATDFRPGQWVPKRPRIIKTEIERGGGFGVNGFYLPMNDSSNPGADFHTTPNSIITLKGEDLPQPRNGAPTTSDAFVSELRQEVSTLGFDGVVKFDGNGDYLSIGADSDLQLGTDDFTIEAYINLGASIASQHQTIIAAGNPESANSFVIQVLQDSDGQNPRALNFRTDARSITSTLGIASNEWTHIAVTKESNVVKLFINGVQRASGTESESLTTAITAIGYRVASSYGYYNGFISNLRVIKGTALYTANFAAPTEPLTNVTNTVLLCCNSSTSATSATVTPGTITANGDVLASRNELTGSLVLAVPGISTTTDNNRITNGNFDSTDITSWITTDNTQSWNNGQLQINRSGGGGATSYQTFTTEVGKRYTVKGTVNSSGSRGDLRIYDGTGFGGTLLLNFSGTNGQTTTQTGSFTAASATTSLGFSVDNNNTTIYVDNIVVKQEDAPRDYSADIKGSGTNKTLTANGNTGVGYEIPSYYGSAISSSAFGDYFDVGINSDWDFGSGDFTVEFWSYHTTYNSTPGHGIWDSTNNQRSWLIYHNSSGLPRFFVSIDGASNNISIQITTAPPTNQWNHYCMERHGSNLYAYINGVCVGVDSSLGTNSLFTPVDPLWIGRWGDGSYYVNGYTQDFRIYKGLAKYKGGFDVPKPYTPVGFESWRTTADTTANNFATLNPLDAVTSNQSGTDYTQATHSNGNLTVILSDDFSSARGSIGISTGKYYWEIRIDANTNSPGMGVIAPGNQLSSYNAGANGASYEPQADRFRKNGVNSYDGTDNKTADGLIVGVALDKNVGIISFFADGTLLSNGTMTGLNALSDVHIPECFTFNDGPNVDNTYTWNFGQNPTFSGQVTAGTNTDDSGKGLFKYAPPTGFLALCEDNLPTPAIADPGDYMKTVLYTGDGNSGRSITGVGFKPDLVWIKSRTNGSRSHLLYDVVRPISAQLSSDATSTETYVADRFNSFDSDGFSGGNLINSDGEDFVAWCWKAGGAAVSNSDGSITSQVSVNQTAGFSIVSYTGTGSTGTVGHGLGKKPSFIILKERYSPANSYSSWQVYHSSLGATQRIQLDLPNDADTVSNIWNDTEPTSDVFSIGNSGAMSENGGTYIAYCWTEIEGYSKFGSYVGNNSDDGPFVYCGFKPAFILQRAVNSLSDWTIMDNVRSSTNPNRKLLYANLSSLEGDGVDDRNPDFLVDFLSNGFKVRATNNDLNNTEEYIFMAFAESPFKTANAK